MAALDEDVISQMIDDMLAYDGLEVPQALWPVATEIERRGCGYLSEARGPGGQWRRLYPVVGENA